MKTFSIKEAYREGWDKWKANKKVLTLAAVLMLILEGIADNDVDRFSVLAFVFMAVVSVVATYVGLGWYQLLLRILDGNKGKMSDLKVGFRLFLKVVATAVVFALIVVCGLILLVVPGIYFSLKYNFAPLLVLENNMGIKQAFHESAKMTEGIKWKLLALMLLTALSTAAGVLVLFVGILVTLPVSALAFLSVYKRLSP